MSAAFNTYYFNKELAKSDASQFNNDIIENYSPSAVVSKLIVFYNTILNISN